MHGWGVDTAQAREIQLSLARRVVTDGRVVNVRLIAGIDLAARGSRGVARGAVVLVRYPELSMVEVQVAEGTLELPYIPGLLSFRESPLILAACERLHNVPDLVLVDGQGLAHPRRLGLASHVGLLLDLPTVGCAKSILCGEHGPLGEQAGCHAVLTDNGEIIGAALRTRPRVKPVYVSVGHRIGLDSALEWVIRCCRGYRLPEPARLAHRAAAGKLAWEPDDQGQDYCARTAARASVACR